MMDGGCRCGAVRYTLALDSLPPVYCCHCTDCQSWTGSAFSEQLLVPEAALTARGPIADFTYTTPSGAVSHHRACATCHTRIFNSNARLPGHALVRAGTLDASATLEPRLHIWVGSKQPWVVLAEDVAQYDAGAPPAEFLAAILR